MKKWMTLCLALAMVLTLCACGGKAAPAATPEPPKPETPEEFLAASSKAMADVSDMRFGMAMELGLSVEGMQVPVTMTMDGEFTQEPSVLHAAITLDMMGMTLPMEMYTEIRDGEGKAYVGMDMGEGMVWESSSAEVPENMAMDAMESLKLLSDLQEDPETTQEGDTVLTTYRGVITGESLKQFMDYGLMDDMEDLMGDTQQAADAITEETKILFSYVIDKETLQMHRIDMDLTQLFAGMDAENLGAAIDTATISITMSDFNAVEPIQIPEEARNAATE